MLPLLLRVKLAPGLRETNNYPLCAIRSLRGGSGRGASPLRYLCLVFTVYFRYHFLLLSLQFSVVNLAIGLAVVVVAAGVVVADVPIGAYS